MYISLLFAVYRIAFAPVVYPNLPISFFAHPPVPNSSTLDRLCFMFCISNFNSDVIFTVTSPPFRNLALPLSLGIYFLDLSAYAPPALPFY